MKNVAATVLAQYAASPRINALIDSFNDAVSPDKFINDFYNLVWNIDTAETYGLDVWGKIVGVNRRLTVSDNFNYLGYAEARLKKPTLTDPRPFDQGPFFSGESTSQTVVLSDALYRKLILMKAMSNITDCAIPGINRMLRIMFADRGRAYIRNDGGMQMSYVFEFKLTTAELAVVQSSGVLPAPPGVNVAYLFEGEAR